MIWLKINYSSIFRPRNLDLIYACIFLNHSIVVIPLLSKPCYKKEKKRLGKMRVNIKFALANYTSSLTN